MTDAAGALGTAITIADAATLVRAATPELFAYAMRLTGGDTERSRELLQQACVELVRAVRSGTANIEVGWLVVVVRRRFLDEVRRRRREAAGLGRLAARRDGRGGEGAPDAPSPVLALLRQMPPDQRAALVLRYVDDLTVAAVAGELGRTVTATESLLARGRRALATLLATEDS